MAQVILISAPESGCGLNNSCFVLSVLVDTESSQVQAISFVKLLWLAVESIATLRGASTHNLSTGQYRERILWFAAKSMNRTDFQVLADLRIQEAHALLTLATPLPDGASYLAGYAVECALKACVAKRILAEVWPEKQFSVDCHTHDIVKLVKLAGLEDTKDDDIDKSPNFGTNWNDVKDWSERSRYERHGLAKAQRLYDAITHPIEGVLP